MHASLNYLLLALLFFFCYTDTPRLMSLSKPSSSKKLRQFKFLQANVRGSYDAQQDLLRYGLEQDHWDLILIQEATRSTDSIAEGMYGYIQVHRSEVREQAGRNISTCVYAKKNSNLGLPEYIPLREEDCPCLGEARDSHVEHICTVAYDLPDGERLYVTNMYNRISENLSEACLTAHLEYEGHLFDAGDFNMHDEEWEGSLDKPKSRAEPLTERYKEEASRRGLTLLTSTMGKPTWKSGNNYSVVDLTWASPELQCSLAKLRDDLNLPGADHVAIETTGLVVTDPRPIEVDDWKNANFEAIGQDLISHVKAARQRPLDTASQVEEEAKDFVDKLQSIMRERVPRVPRSPHLRFKIDNKQMETLNKRIKLACDRRDREHENSRSMWKSHGFASKDKDGVFAPYSQQDRKVKQLQADLQKLRSIELGRQVRTSYAKDTMWRKYGNAKMKGRPRAPITVPHLRLRNSHGETVGRTTSAHGKVSTLHLDWFGKPPPSEESVKPLCTIEESPESDRPDDPDQTVSKGELTIIFKKLNPRKSPGHDGISPKFLINFGPLFMSYLARLWSACLRLAIFPYVFKIGRCIPIPKCISSGAIYDLPNLFRPICLLSSLGKTLESYLADVLSKLARTRNLLPSTQMAVRGRSVIHALLYILEVINMARRCKLAVALVCVDQKGAYNNVLPAELLRVFRILLVPEWIIAMVSSFLSNRFTTIRIPGFESNPTRCRGVPQGSPVSPILFAFFTFGLLQVYELKHEKGRVFKLAFSDDTYILVIGTSVEEIKQVVEHQYRLCKKWAASSGAEFAAHKTKVMIFASPDQHDDKEPMSYYIPGFNDEFEYNCKNTGPGQFMKVLGVRFAVNSQGNLTWAAHWAHLEKMFEDVVKDFSRVVRSTWGLSVSDALHVCKAGARARLMYGCIAWCEQEDNPWWEQEPSEYMSREDPKANADPLGNYNPSVSLKPYFTPNDVRIRRQQRLDEMGYKLVRMSIGSFARSPRWYRLAETFFEPFTIFAHRSNLTTRANIMASPEGDTIKSAGKRVQDYADKELGEDARLSRERLGSDSTDPTIKVEQQAEAWRADAVKQLSSQDRQKKNRKRKRPASEDDPSDDDALNNDVADDPISEEGEDAMANFRENWFDLPMTEESDLRDQPKLHRVKLKLKAMSDAWSEKTIARHHEYWRIKKKNEWVAANRNDKKRIIPAALETKWGKHNLDRWRKLSRPLDYILFGLRTEYIGLLHHRRELCGSDLKDTRCRVCNKGFLETVTHLLHYCPALLPEREQLYDEVFSTVDSIKTYPQMRANIIKEAPELVAKYALVHFPIDQLEWTRENMLDLLLLPEEDGEDG